MSGTRADVTVSWTVADGDSEITATDGCDQTVIDGDTAGLTLTCAPTSAGERPASRSPSADKYAARQRHRRDRGALYILGSVPDAVLRNRRRLVGRGHTGRPTLGGNPDGSGTLTATCDGRWTMPATRVHRPAHLHRRYAHGRG
ncbi:MAG: hypothetical protein R2851_20205 [Caldilineaceae bacterium]